MSFTYTFKESLAGFKRNRAATLITIFTVSIALLLLGVFTIITINFGQVVDQIRGRMDVEVFLKEGLTLDQHRQTGLQLKAIRGVEDATYISKEKAAEIFHKEFGENYGDMLDVNPLPASFQLKIHEGYINADSIAAIQKKALRLKTVDDVVYRKALLALIDRRAQAFSYATLFIGIVLGLSAIILVANTIRLTIYAKREIIRTMKLVGATSMFIRMPFVIEGLLHGLAGGIIASALLGVSYAFFIAPISEDLLLNIPVNFSFYLFLVGLGALLGLIGSVLSIGRFLREALVTHAYRI